jgi:hypothetical protein
LEEEEEAGKGCMSLKDYMSLEKGCTGLGKGCMKLERDCMKLEKGCMKLKKGYTTQKEEDYKISTTVMDMEK